MSIEYDPFTARRILAGTYFGGLYESNDDGATWKHVETAFGTFSVFAVAFDPSRRGVVYVGTLLGGVFKSEDGGVTWAARNKGLPDLVVQAVAIDPANPGTLLAVTGNKLLRSSDGAENWSLVPLAQEAGVPSCLLWDYRSPGSVYLGTQGHGVWRSLDSGVKWEPFMEGIGERVINSLSIGVGAQRKIYAATSDGYAFRVSPSETKWSQLNIWPYAPPAAVNSVFVHPATINVLIAGTGEGAYLSRDNGATWTKFWNGGVGKIRSDLFATKVFFAGISGGLHLTTDLGRTAGKVDFGLQNVFVGTLAAFDNGASSILLAGTEYGVFSAKGRPFSWAPPALHQRVFSLHPVPHESDKIYAGTEAFGVWKSTDGGGSWNVSSNGLLPNTIYAIDKGGTPKSVLWAGSSSGLYYSYNDGATWNPSSLVTASKILSVAADPREAFTAYFGSFGGTVFRTTNAAQSIEDISSGLPDENIVALRVPKESSSNLYAVTSAGSLFLSERRGEGWVDITPLGFQALTLEIDPERPWIMYLGTAGNGVLKTESGGIEWRQQSNGIGSAYVLSLAIHPKDPKTCYAGGSGVIYKSTDGGESWNSVSTGLPQANVIKISPDPDDPERVYVSLEGRGVYRTTDGGGAWQALEAGLPNDGAMPILVDPAKPSRLFAGSSLRGVFTSEDGGDTWQPANENMSLFVRGVATDAGNSSIVYAGSLTAGFFRSDDAGSQWKSTGLRDEVIMTVKAHPRKSGTVYAGTTSGILRSLDYGDSWRIIGQRVAYVLSICPDPRDINTVYIGGASGALVKSSDGGRSWSPADRGLPAQNITSIVINPENGNLHASVEQGPIYLSTDGGRSWRSTPNALTGEPRVVQLVYDPVTKAYYAATTNTGILVSLDGLSWASFNTGLTSLSMTSVIGVPGRPGILIASSGDAGLYLSDGGANWVPIGSGIPTRKITSLRATRDGALFALAESNVYRSSDFGSSWTMVGVAFESGAPVALFSDPFQPRTLYVTTSGGRLELSRDGGESWHEAGAGLPASPVNTIAFGSDSTTLFAGSLGEGLLISRDSGETWTASATPETINPFVLAIFVDPNNPEVIYAGTSGGVIRSRDGGETWVSINSGLPHSAILALVADPTVAGTVYAGTARGVYVTQNDGENWTEIQGGMFHSNVTSLAIDPKDPRLVYAGTEGGGVFKYERP
ncbi:MAG: hypothetical protein IPP47_07320 [Bryobacterales bacterium]|nr:hypothetical protein [Bryobacterales bacterium]